VRTTACILVALMALAGCATHSATAGARVVTVGQRDNGHTIRVSPGTTIDVVLHSTYWTFTPQAGSGALRPDRAPSVVASSPGSGCVAGQGCGTVTARFTAISDGTARIRATRTSCGEALACSPAQSAFTVTIAVSGASS
jgi:hypothetical protein